MPTPTPDQLDNATIDLVFALRNSLTDAGPSLIDFWSGRCASAIHTAAAGSSNAAQALTIACRKLQIDDIATSYARQVKNACDVIDQDHEAWATHIDRTIPYIMVLAKLDRDNRKTTPKKKATTTSTSTSDKELAF